jgi:hypothetical protein
LSCRAIVESTQQKVLETIELTAHLVGLAPDDKLEWRPVLAAAGIAATDLGHLLGHLLDCLAGFCAAFHAAFPAHLRDFDALRSLTVNHLCSKEEALIRIEAYLTCIVRGFECCTDQDLGRKLPTVFVPGGETLMTILLGNLEHLINHKYQLFFYLKLLGIPAGTQDLYKWRGPR